MGRVGPRRFRSRFSGAGALPSLVFLLFACSGGRGEERRGRRPRREHRGWPGRHRRAGRRWYRRCRLGRRGCRRWWVGRASGRRRRLQEPAVPPIQVPVRLLPSAAVRRGRGHDAHREGVRPCRQGAALQRHRLRPQRGAGGRSPTGPRATSAACALVGAPVVQTKTAADGSFTLGDDTPTCRRGPNIPLVIQVGKWRREVTIPNVAGVHRQRAVRPERHPPAAQQERRPHAPDCADHRRRRRARVPAAQDRHRRLGVHHRGGSRPREPVRGHGRHQRVFARAGRRGVHAAWSPGGTTWRT